MLRVATKRLYQAPSTVAKTMNNTNQRRSVQSAQAGPPKYPLTTADVFIFGGAFMFSLVAVPLWGVFSVPAWSKIHKNAA